MTEKKLVYFKCDSCGKASYPLHAICPQCKKNKFSQIELPTPGIVLTYTKLFAVPKGVNVIPLILGIVEFENGIRVTGQIEADEVNFGDKVYPIWGKLRESEGKEIFGFKFKKIE
jgi:uncharacterized OB-fold protein